MKRLSVLFFTVVLISVLFISPAFADGGGDAIWGKLAGKAALIGDGLRRSGYMIAGLGLIFFSFMAIFNKISWKNLAYIMLSCFVLSIMFGLINYFSDNKAESSGIAEFKSSNAGTNTDIQGGVGQAGGKVPEVKQ